MITLNDYLYSGDTVFKILKKYAHDSTGVGSLKSE